MLAGLLQISLLRPTVTLDGKARNGGVQAEHAFDVFQLENRIATAEMPADEFHRQAALYNDPRGLRITPDVVFGRRRDVAFATGRAAHDDATADFCRDFRPALQR